MATSEERRKILEMVSEGKLSAGEAAELLSAATEAAAAPPPPEAKPAKEEPAPEVQKSAPEADNSDDEAAAAKAPSWLHIRVGDLKSGKQKVSVNIPLRMIKFGLKMGGAFTPGLGEIDWSAISESLAAGEKGILVDVADEEDGEHVQIYVD